MDMIVRKKGDCGRLIWCVILVNVLIKGSISSNGDAVNCQPFRPIRLPHARSIISWFQSPRFDAKRKSRMLFVVSLVVLATCL